MPLSCRCRPFTRVPGNDGNSSSYFDRQLDGSRTLPAAPVNCARCGAADGQPGCSYTSTTPADATWDPDSGGELTDGKRVHSSTAPEWQGRNAPGNYRFTMDLGTSKTVTEINTT